MRAAGPSEGSNGEEPAQRNCAGEAGHEVDFGNGGYLSPRPPRPPAIAATTDSPLARPTARANGHARMAAAKPPSTTRASTSRLEVSPMIQTVWVVKTRIAWKPSTNAAVTTTVSNPGNCRSMLPSAAARATAIVVPEPHWSCMSASCWSAYAESMWPLVLRAPGAHAQHAEETLGIPMIEVAHALHARGVAVQRMRHILRAGVGDVAPIDVNDDRAGGQRRERVDGSPHGATGEIEPIALINLPRELRRHLVEYDSGASIEDELLQVGIAGPEQLPCRAPHTPRAI